MLCPRLHGPGSPSPSSVAAPAWSHTQRGAGEAPPSPLPQHLCSQGPQILFTLLTSAGTWSRPHSANRRPLQRKRSECEAWPLPSQRCFGNSPTAAIPSAVFNRELPLRFQMPLHALTQQESHPCKLGLQFAPRTDIFAGLGRFLQRLPSTGLCWWVAAPWYPGAATSFTSPQLKFNSKKSSCSNNTRTFSISGP